VIGEIELAAQYLPGSIVAITGSNGKTTTTTLAGDVVTAGGFPTVVGGNIDARDFWLNGPGAIPSLSSKSPASS
jgi:UDP-N-acetylmuramoylalanine-D-glutamate ligase